MYYIVSFPEFSDPDAAWIDGIRATHDAEKRAVIGPHFTFVFAVPETIAMSPQTRTHLSQIARTTQPIKFTCTRTVPFADHMGPEGYVFLSPNDGNEEMVALRADLHSGPLSAFLSKEIDWIAHMTIAKTADMTKANMLSDKLNQDSFTIKGRLAALSLARFDGVNIDIIQEFNLNS